MYTIHAELELAVKKSRVGQSVVSVVPEAELVLWIDPGRIDPHPRNPRDAESSLSDIAARASINQAGGRPLIDSSGSVSAYRIRGTDRWLLADGFRRWKFACNMKCAVPVIEVGSIEAGEEPELLPDENQPYSRADIYLGMTKSLAKSFDEFMRSMIFFLLVTFPVSPELDARYRRLRSAKRAGQSNPDEEGAVWKLLFESLRSKAQRLWMISRIDPDGSIMLPYLRQEAEGRAVPQLTQSYLVYATKKEILGKGKFSVLQALKNGPPKLEKTKQESAVNVVDCMMDMGRPEIQCLAIQALAEVKDEAGLKTVLELIEKAFGPK